MTHATDPNAGAPVDPALNGASKSLWMWALAFVVLVVVMVGLILFDRAFGAEDPQMSVTAAAVLGVVEGVTEYLPVSSTGHLILAQEAMGIGPPDGATDEEREQAKIAADAYAICIQGGAILAVLGLYFRRVRQMLLGLIGRSAAGLRLALHIIVGLIPAVVLGLALEKHIKGYLFSGGPLGLWPIIFAWFVGGVLILAVSYHRKRTGHTPREGLTMEQMTWRMALAIGFIQCIAMWPGVSRSLMTIVGGVLVGLSLPAAVEFSFLLGVATLGGATLKDAIEYGPVMLETYGVAPLIVGFIAATISAAIAVEWMVAYLNKRGLEVFGYYRIAIAIGVAVAVLGGWLVV